MSSAPVAVGDIIGGRYRLEGTLGEGGMAAVYRARHLGTGRPCALKLVHAQLGTVPKLVELFIREAQVGAKIGPNPHIVEVLDAAADETRKVPYLVMELLDGETIEASIERNGPMPIPLVRELFAQLGDALNQAHRAGVVHRDLKPSNLFLTRDRAGKPLLKVLDFGIAKVLEGDESTGVTQIGTPSFAAPEQLSREFVPVAQQRGIQIATSITPATDVWAMGLIAYSMLTGFPGNQFWSADTSTNMPMKVALSDLDPPSRRAGDRAPYLPPGFDVWFGRCLRKNAAERWQSAAEAVAELDRALTGAAPSGPPGREGSSYPPVAPVVTAPMGPLSGPATPPSFGAPAYGAPPYAAAAPPLPYAAPPMPQMPYGAPPVPPTPYSPFGPPPAQHPHGPSFPVMGAAPPYGFPPPARPGASTSSSPSRAVWVIPLVVVGLLAVTLFGSLAVYGVRRYRRDVDVRACATEKKRCAEACDASDIPSCARLAYMTETGSAGATKDLAKAGELYERACDASDQTSCAELARFYLFGRGNITKDEARAVALVTKSCDDGAARGCLLLAEMTRDGDAGLKADDVRAAQLFKRACDGKAMSACKSLGSMHESGRGGLPKDLGRAATLYTQACEGGNAAGCNDVGVLYDTGRGVAKNEVRAAELFKQACDGGELVGCCNLGAMHETGRGGVTKDDARARELFTRACDQGSAIGCKSLGLQYENGAGGLPKDLAKAASLYKQSCDARYPMGCSLLGALEERGSGVTKDEAQAVAHYKLACDANNGSGCFGLASATESGRGGLAKDDAKAAGLFKHACEIGGPLQACTAYGILVSYGRVSRDPSMGMPYFKQACDGDNAPGCANVGYLYLKGMSVPKDRGRGGDLLRKSCTAGYEWACEQLKLNGIARGL